MGLKKQKTSIIFFLRNLVDFLILLLLVNDKHTKNSFQSSFFKSGCFFWSSMPLKLDKKEVPYHNLEGKIKTLSLTKKKKNLSESLSALNPFSSIISYYLWYRNLCLSQQMWHKFLSYYFFLHLYSEISQFFTFFSLTPSPQTSNKS